MESKPLLYGLIGFFAGGLLVSIAATTFNKSATTNNASGMTMSAMTESLRGKTGDDYDAAFIAYMIEHHQAAVDMAKLSEQRAKHDEIKRLSNDIVTAQQKEITDMQRWLNDWGYSAQAGHDSAEH